MEGNGSGGGAIRYFNGADGRVIIDKSTFKKNTAAEGTAGAIYLDGAKMTLTDSTFDGNAAIGSGAIYVGGGEYSISGSTFTNNKATNSGGGAFRAFNTDKVRISKSSFSNNTAYRGGAIYLTSGDAIIADSTITNNTAQGNASNGGGIYVQTSSKLTIPGTTISGNSVKDGGANPNAGGGICTEIDRNTITGGSVVNNGPKDFCS